MISDLAIFNRSLLPYEVAQIYNSKAPIQDTSRNDQVMLQQAANKSFQVGDVRITGELYGSSVSTGTVTTTYLASNYFGLNNSANYSSHTVMFLPFQGIIDGSRKEVGTFSRPDAVDGSAVTGEATTLKLVSKNANEPRFDRGFDSNGVNTDTSYNTGNFGVYVEDSRKNLLLDSSFETLTPWTPNGSLTATQSTYRTMHGNNSINLVSTANTRYYQTVDLSSLTAGTTIQVTGYVYRNEASAWGGAIDSSIASLYARTDDALTALATAYYPLGNGWYRLTASFNSTAVANWDIGIYVPSGRNLYADAFQAEVKSDSTSALFPSSFIPTTTSSITRAAETLSYPLPASFKTEKGSFSFWFKPSWTRNISGDTVDKILFYIPNIMRVRLDAASNDRLVIEMYSAGSWVATANTSSTTINQLAWNHFTCGWYYNYVYCRLNGTAASSGAAWTPQNPTGKTLYIGSLDDGTLQANSQIAAFTLFDSFLDSTQQYQLYINRGKFDDFYRTDVALLNNDSSNSVQTGSFFLNGAFRSGFGSAALPAFSFNNDADTGIFRSAANQIAFSNNGTQSMVLDASGNLGIGLTNPNYKLDVSGDINVTGALRANGSAGVNGQVLTSTGTGLAWTDLPTATTQYWQLNSGTLSPLNITNSLNLGATATSSATVHLAGTTGDNSFINTGNFGIGTTNPGFKLDVTGDVGVSTYLRLIDGGATQYVSASTPVIYNYNSGDLYLQARGNGANQKDIRFVTNNGTDARDTRMIIKSSGNVGIGTTNPRDILEIKDTFIFGANSSWPSMWPAGVTPSSTNYIFQSSSNGSSVWFNAASGGYTAFAIANSEKMRVSSTGNVGIGLTNPTAKLDIAGDASTSGSLVFRGNGTGPTIDVLNGNRLDFQTSPGGDALLAAKVTLLNNGNVGIGTTNPLATLQVDSSTSGSSGQELLRLSRNSATRALRILNYDGTTGVAGFTIQGTDDLSAWKTLMHLQPTTGNVGIGLTNPNYKLDVTGDINLTGALYDNGSAGVAGQILSTTGTGVQWIDAPTGSSTNASPWNWSAGVIYPFSITDAVNLGNAATASATVHLAGTPGDNSFINTGNFGIGTTNPLSKLFISGTTGNLFTINDTIQDLVNVTSAQTTFNNPTSFTSAGDVSIAYDLNFTNPTTSYIKSAAPLVLQAGELFNSSDLTLRTFNKGNVVVDSEALTVIGSATVSGSVAVGYTTAPSGSGNGVFSGNVGIGLINPSYKLDVAGDINLTGAIRSSGNAGISGQILSSTGTGVAWIDTSTISGAQYWQLNAGVLTPTEVSNAINLGNVSTASATVHLAGKTGDNSFINTGNFGIGDTTPASALTVGAGDAFQVNSSGAITAAKSITNTGTINQTGGIVNLNDSSNYNTNINTGTSTGSVTIGGNANTVAVNSSNWDISSVGAASGLTGISSSGTINFTKLAGNHLVFTDGGDNLVSTASSQFVADSISDETGSGALVFGTTPVFTTNITTPIAIGGTTPSSSLKLKSTSGVGTTDFISMNVGNNGSTEALRAISNGYVGIGTTTPSQMLQVGTGTGFLVNNNGAIMNANGATISGSVRLSALGTGILHSNASGYLSSSALNLATEVTGVLPIANGGTNNNNVTSPFVSGKFIAYDGTRLSSTAYDASSFETALTFQNGLSRALNVVEWGGTLNKATTIDQNGFNIAFTGLGNFGIGAAVPSQKLDVAGFFVVDTGNSRVGIGTTAPTAKLEIAGSSSTISNTSGDITFNAASNLFDFSGDSLKNFLNATASGQIQLGNFADSGRPSPLGAGSLIYSTTQNSPQFYNGTVWQDLTNFFTRTATGTVYATNWYDSINLGAITNNGASSSATVRISGDATNSSFFVNPVAFGFRTDSPVTSYINQPVAGYKFAIQTSGGIIPKQNGVDRLGYTGFEWSELHLANNIVKNGSALITLNDLSLIGGVWHSPSGFKVGTGSLAAGAEFEVTGDAYISNTLATGGQVTVGGGTGKMDVGVVDPPYTINGLKYATYMSSMVGMKEETVGKVTTTETDLVEGLGYRTLIDLDQQPVGSDVWLFSKTTNIKNNIGNLSVLLTPEGQAKSWYEIDQPNKILAIYSSTPTNITYRLTAPRFDSTNFSNTRTSSAPGYIITSANNNTNTNSIFDNPVTSPELVANVDGSYLLKVNNVENKEVASFMTGIIANLKAGAATIASLVTDNLTVRTKLISPIADIDQLKTIDATVSGTLYANNIKGQTVDKLTSEINLLNQKYSTASAILADLQARYSTYASLFGATSSALVAGDPLALSPLDKTTPNIPSDLALNSLNVHTLIANDLLANGSIFTKSISSFDTDLFIQPSGDKLVNIGNSRMIIYPDGKVLVNGDLLVTGNVLAKGLDSETATVSGTLAVGSSKISTESANFNQLTTSGLIIASGNTDLAGNSGTKTNSNATIGVSAIAAGTIQIDILNNKVTPSTLIYVTPTSDTAGRVLYVKFKTEGVGFTVGITGEAYTSDITFNYWLVETK